MKTKSIWGKPTKNFFNFLNKIKKTKLPKTICILGCADGRYVIPAAKKGFDVLAIDNDVISIYGGNCTVDGKIINICGLKKRVIDENLEEKITIIKDDFIKYNSKTKYSGVFTSGSIHYENNFKYSLKKIIFNIKKYVSINGILYFEYIHKSQYDNNPKKHFITSNQIKDLFKYPKWKILSNKKKKYVELSNPRVNKKHSIIWGRLYAVKNS